MTTTQTAEPADASSYDAIEGGIAFSDIIASTALAERIGDAAWLRLMHEQEQTTRRLARDHDVEVVGCVGDGFLLQSGDPHHLVANRYRRSAVRGGRGDPHFGWACTTGTTTARCTRWSDSTFTSPPASPTWHMANEIVLSNAIAERTGLTGRTKVQMLRGVSRPCRFRTITIDKEPN